MPTLHLASVAAVIATAALALAHQVDKLHDAVVGLR